MTLVKGRSILFNHFIDMRTTVNLSISYRKNVFLLENLNKNAFFLHEMDKLNRPLHCVFLHHEPDKNEADKLDPND